MDSRLAISRISCSRCNLRALATVVHRPPSSAGATSAISLHVWRPHFRLRSVCTLQMRGTVGRVWSQQISKFTCPSLKAAKDPEVCMARICREAGARVKENQLLLCVDKSGRGEGSQARAAHPRIRIRQEPEVPRVAHRDKVPFLLDGIRGGRTVELQRSCKNLAWYKSPSVPWVLRRSTQLLFFQRWTALQACSIHRAYAASLLRKRLGTCATCACANGPAVHMGDLDRLPCA